MIFSTNNVDVELQFFLRQLGKLENTYYMIFSTSKVDVELQFFCTNLENLRILTLYSESYSFKRKPIFNNKIIWIFNYILILLI